MLDSEVFARYPAFAARAQWILTHRPDLAALVSRWGEPGKNGRILLSLLRSHRMKALLARMLDETEFLSDYGVRAVSKTHARTPFVLDAGGMRLVVDYEPGEFDDFALRRKLELARPGMDADQLSACRGDP